MSEPTMWRSARRLACLAMVLIGAALPIRPAAAVDALAWQAEEPRAFGWHLGDVITRRVHIDVPAGWLLDEASLPPRGRGGALELRQVRVQPAPAGLTLELDYQVFVAPVQPRRVELPTVALRFDPLAGPAASAVSAAARELRVQPWPVMVGPLVGEDTPAGRGFGELRPDRPAPLLDTHAPRRAVQWALALAFLAAAVLLLRPWVEAWWWRRRRPFAHAWRAVESALRHADGSGVDAAFRALHAAFNAHAGRVLLREDAHAWLAREPGWQPLAGRIDAFFAASRERFFGSAAAASTFGRDELRRLARALRDAERLGAPTAAAPPQPAAAGNPGAAP